MEIKKCLMCGLPMEGAPPDKKYCSVRCAQKYYRLHRDMVIKSWPSLTFTCAKCGKLVVTEPGPSDKRTRFCCASCERQYWRHPPQDNPSHNQVFHGVDHYASYERKTNE